MGEYLRLLIYGPQLHYRCQSPNELFTYITRQWWHFFPTKFLNRSCRNILWEAVHLPPAKGMGCFQLEVWRRLISIGTQSPKCIMSILKYDERIEFSRNQSSLFHFHAKAPITDGITHLQVSKLNTGPNIHEHLYSTPFLLAVLGHAGWTQPVKQFIRPLSYCLTWFYL